MGFNVRRQRPYSLDANTGAAEMSEQQTADQMLKECPDCHKEYIGLEDDNCCPECFENFNGMTIEELIGE
jgi:hypothetical protein